jgi:hypothetical protein
LSRDSITAAGNIPQEGVPPNFGTLPIVKEDTNHGNQGQEQAEQPNKYLYDEFAGYSGERYLDTLLQQILPYALARTWRYAVEFQAPSNVCYVGTFRLASRIKPQQRKVQLDFQELEARGLMTRYPARLPVVQQDGKIRHEAVTVKDFSALYALAHEYHCWLHSPDYIPAERDYLDLIMSDPQLVRKLIRFDNYRRLIECQKPGRKPQAKPAHLYYQCTLPPENDQEQRPSAPAPVQHPRTEDLNTNLYFNSSDKTSSSYRVTNTDQMVSPRNSDSSDSEGIGPLTIRSEFVASIQQSEVEETKEEVRTNQSNPNPKQPNSPSDKESRAERAEDVKEYNIEELKRDPFAMAAALVEMRGRSGSPPPQPVPTSHSQKDQRPRREIPGYLSRKIAKYAQDLGDNPRSLQSDITRAAKLYFASQQIFSGFRNSWFNEQLEAAFADTCHARGIQKRMPYLFSCLENRLELTEQERAFIRSDEPLYEDGYIGDFVKG